MIRDVKDGETYILDEHRYRHIIEYGLTIRVKKVSLRSDPTYQHPYAIALCEILKLGRETPAHYSHVGEVVQLNISYQMWSRYDTQCEKDIYDDLQRVLLS